MSTTTSAANRLEGHFSCWQKEFYLSFLLSPHSISKVSTQSENGQRNFIGKINFLYFFFFRMITDCAISSFWNLKEYIMKIIIKIEKLLADFWQKL